MKTKRSGGIDIDHSKVKTNGDMIGRDKIIHAAPREKKTKSLIQLSFLNAVAVIGMYLFGFLAAIAGCVLFNLFNDKASSGVIFLCVALGLGILFAVLALFFYNLSQRTDNTKDVDNSEE